jgi:transposase
MRIETNTVPGLTIAFHPLDLFPQLRIVDRIDPGFRRLTLRAQRITASASCPDCRITSGRVHGHYWRSLSDLPSFGRPVVLLVQVRRFRCINKRCPRRTFGEGLSGIARPRARHTERLRRVTCVKFSKLVVVADVVALVGNASALSTSVAQAALRKASFFSSRR